MNNIEEFKEHVFDEIRHIDEYGNEYWRARELMPLLGYIKWQKFLDVINRSIKACQNSNNIVSDHFTQAGKMIKIAKGAKREVIDYKLSRYACYLIAQNSDSRKK